jgi:hypothetical protein
MYSKRKLEIYTSKGEIGQVGENEILRVSQSAVILHSMTLLRPPIWLKLFPVANGRNTNRPLSVEWRRSLYSY